MRVFICIDECGGMLFGGRRVSRDSAVIKDICDIIGDNSLYISPFSEKLFCDADIKLKVSERFLKKADENDFCFVEDKELLPYADEIFELVIYNWNRRYPSDIKIDLEPKACGFELCEAAELSGSSHEKITKEIYRK